jgi:hexokinase
MTGSPNETLDVVHLGLTFSFPVEQTALGSGKILTWTKGFSAKNAIGHDVVKLLQDAFDRKHIHVKCIALVNDVSLSPLRNSYILNNSDRRSTPFSGLYLRRLSLGRNFWHWY